MNDNKEKIVIICKEIFQVVGKENKITFNFKLRDTNGGYYQPVCELRKADKKINLLLQLLSLKSKIFICGGMKIEHQKNDIFLVNVDKWKLTVPINEKKRKELVRLITEVDINRKVRWVKD